MNTVLFTNKVSVALAKIYKRGFKVDVDTLESVQQEFQNEKSEIEKRLQIQLIVTGKQNSIHQPSIFW